MIDASNILGNTAGNRLFMNERHSDVAITVVWDGCNWHFPAHRLILSIMSEVFRQMFETDMKESSDGELVMEDCNPLTVKQFLKYLYIGVLDFNGWKEAVDLLKIAHKYYVHTLVLLCETYLCTVITFSNSCYLHEIAQTYSLTSLLKLTSNFILEAAFVVTSTDGFFNIKPTSLEFFLSSPRLNVENEFSVLACLKEWAVVQCSQRGILLTHSNVLSAMKPYLRYIKWNSVPEDFRTYVPEEMFASYTGRGGRRNEFHVPALFPYHIGVLKFMMELGAFNDRIYENGELNCLKFGVDNHAYISGFKIVGKFRSNSLPALGPSSLTLGKDDNRSPNKFNLHSVPWITGSTAGNYVWRELIAYLPFPIRIDPFSPYVINLTYGRTSNKYAAKWPVTRLESPELSTDIGHVKFHCLSPCYGITQLFLLPAPPIKNICNDTD